ncbi:hypothetical protein AVEN_9229-1 [Araneus ventricosus]|uniref:Uncharacterized protein n=1 Tax=Araneus ventricosus TaxID=182803 RepID=A0A4Y2QJ14_ARAVE|nr:hypothetical protein AVEN_9229-1 [Araneus ventricosus]
MVRDCDTFSAVSDYKECAGIVLTVLRELFSGNLLTNAWVISQSQVNVYNINVYFTRQKYMLLVKNLNLTIVNPEFGSNMFNDLIFDKVWLNAQNATDAPVKGSDALGVPESVREIRTLGCQRWSFNFQ